MIEKALPADYDALAELWEASVRATHYFLREEDILFYRPRVRHEYLPAVDLYVLREDDGPISGFLGTSPGKIEMLFIHPESRGRGVGKALLRFATRTLGIRKVDVNEQNEQAVGFYRHFGFEVVGRTETDGLGKPYPVLEMELRV